MRNLSQFEIIPLLYLVELRLCSFSSGFVFEAARYAGFVSGMGSDFRGGESEA